MAAASSQPAPPARNKSDTWRVRAAQLQVTTPQHPPGWRSRFARISGPRPGSCGCPICNLVLTVSMSAELLGTPHASGKKKRKSSSSPQTDAALKRCSLSPQAVTVSNAVTFSPLRGSLARVMASAAATTSTHAQKKHCRDGRQHNRGRPSRQQWVTADKIKWIDRVHFERPREGVAPPLSILIRNCLVRNGIPFVTGNEGLLCRPPVMPGVLGEPPNQRRGAVLPATASSRLMLVRLR